MSRESHGVEPLHESLMSVKETLSQMTARDPDQDSLESDSLSGEWKRTPTSYPTFTRPDGLSPRDDNATPALSHDLCGSPTLPSLTRDATAVAIAPSNATATIASASIASASNGASTDNSQQRAFFVDLQRLPSPPPPAAVTASSTRHNEHRHCPPADSVYLYIDMNSAEQPSSDKLMSVSYHGGSVQQQQQPPERASLERLGGDGGGGGVDMTRSGVSFTVADDEAPHVATIQRRLQRRQRHLQQQMDMRRRRNLSLNSRQSDVTPGGAGAVGGVTTGGRITVGASMPARASLTPPSTRRQSYGLATSSSAAAAAAASAGRVAGPMRRVSDTLHTRSVARRVSTTAAGAVVTSASSSSPAAAVVRQRNFLRAHSGRSACSAGDGAAVSSASSGGGAATVTSPRLRSNRATASPPKSKTASAAVAAVSRLPRGRAGDARRAAAVSSAGTAVNDASVSGAGVCASPAMSEDGASDASSVHASKPPSSDAESYRAVDDLRELTADLMTLLTSGENADVTVEVDGCQLAAHRCVLAARSEYFRRRLPDSVTSVVRLNGHAVGSVRLLLAHLYTGVTRVPDEADACDLLCLCVRVATPRLQRAAELAVRARLCHMFHKPCDVCVPGVLETLGVASECQLAQLLERCRGWLAQHRVTVWSHASVRRLDPHFLRWCFQYTTQLSESSVLDVMLDCGQLMRALPSHQQRLQHVYEDDEEVGVEHQDEDVDTLLPDLLDKLASEAVVLASRILPTLLSSERLMRLCETSVSCDVLCPLLTAAADIQHGADACACLDVLAQLHRVPRANWSQSFLCMLESVEAACRVRSGSAQHHISSASLLTHSASQDCRSLMSGAAVIANQSSYPPSSSSPPPPVQSSLAANVASSFSPSSQSSSPSTAATAKAAVMTTTADEDAVTSPYLRRKQLLGLCSDSSSGSSRGGDRSVGQVSVRSRHSHQRRQHQMARSALAAISTHAADADQPSGGADADDCNAQTLADAGVVPPEGASVGRMNRSESFTISRHTD